MSSAPFEELSQLDRVIHEPARLAILTALAACHTADFRYLQSVTALTQGNLSRHLTKLEARGLIEIEKSIKGKVPNTSVRLTRTGRNGIELYWRRLERFGRSAKVWLTRMRRAPAE